MCSRVGLIIAKFFRLLRSKVDGLCNLLRYDCFCVSVRDRDSAFRYSFCYNNADTRDNDVSQGDRVLLAYRDQNIDLFFRHAFICCGVTRLRSHSIRGRFGFFRFRFRFHVTSLKGNSGLNCPVTGRYFLVKVVQLR